MTDNVELITFGDEVIDPVESKPEPQPAQNEPVWYVAELPSKGRAGYSDQVFYRNILGRDEKMIASATAKNFKLIITDVLKSLLRDKKDFEKLTLEDRDFLLMWIWANNYSTKRELEIDCDVCGHVDDIEIDLTEVPVKELSEDYKNPFRIDLSNGDHVDLRLRTIGDENKAEMIAKANPDLDQDTIELALCATFSKIMNVKEKIAYMENLTGKDNAMIRTFHEYFTYGLKKALTHNCTSCGEVTTYALPFHAGDFLPTVSDDFGALVSASKGAKAESS